MARLGSRSDAQKQAELAALEMLSQELSKPLEHKRIQMDGCTFDVDGFNQTEMHIVLVEVWARIGKPKAAQKSKVLKDILKLTLLKQLYQRNYPASTVECYLLFIDEEAVQHLKGTSWASVALREFDIATRNVSIDTELRATVLKAQTLQDIRIV